MADDEKTKWNNRNVFYEDAWSDLDKWCAHVR